MSLVLQLSLVFFALFHSFFTLSVHPFPRHEHAEVIIAPGSFGTIDIQAARLCRLGLVLRVEILPFFK